MDTRRTIIAICLMMGLVIIWRPLYISVGQKLGYDMTKLEPAASTQPTDDSAISSAPATTPSLSSTQPGAAPQLAGGAINIAATTQPSRAELGSPAREDRDFPLALHLVSEGAGIDSVVLNDYKQTTGGLEPYVYQQPYDGFENLSRPLATRTITINGTAIDTSGVSWQLTSNTQDSASYALMLTDSAGAPLARITKRFDVFRRTNKTEGGGYEVAIKQSIENLTAAPLDASIIFNGPTTPPRELDRGSDRMTIGGYLNGESVYVSQNYVESFGLKLPAADYTKSAKNDYPLLWAGTASVYFDALVRPLPSDPKNQIPDNIAKVEATSLNPDAADSKAHLVTMTFETTTQHVAAGAIASIQTRAFFGPKWRQLLKNDYFAQLPRGYDSTLVITSSYCGICTFGWLINTLVWLLNSFHLVLRDWGLSIIALVFVVRLCLHPITKKSQENMAAMSKFGPEIDKLKKKHADDSDALNKAMMGFYKEHGATPILGCLPMFLQMPIWIALWSALQSTFELRQAPFLRFGWFSLTWIKDLSQPDHLITLAHPFTLFNLIPISGLNILPIAMAGVFFVQQKYFTPRAPGMTPEQEQQQKMMQWMSLLFPVMLYPGPSGLNLYILTSTTFGIIESKRIRDHIKAREEAATAGKVFVDPGKKFGRGNAIVAKTAPDNGKPPGAIARWLTNLQEKAAEVQREQERRRDKK